MRDRSVATMTDPSTRLCPAGPVDVPLVELSGREVMEWRKESMAEV